MIKSKYGKLRVYFLVNWRNGIVSAKGTKMMMQFAVNLNATVDPEL